jgi:hypothetical protein
MYRLNAKEVFVWLAQNEVCHENFVFVMWSPFVPLSNPAAFFSFSKHWAATQAVLQSLTIFSLPDPKAK